MSKPFDLRAALEGQPIIYNKREYTFIGTVLTHLKALEYTNGSSSLMVTFDGFTSFFYEPVFMAPKKVNVTKYVNIYAPKSGDSSEGKVFFHDTLEKAEACADAGFIVKGLPIEYEVTE